MADLQGRCWHCGGELRGADYARENRCPGCQKATHACRNCRFFAPGRPNACLEPLVEPVLDKERANFCDYFEPTDKTSAQPGQATPTDDLLKAAEDLFN